MLRAAENTRQERTDVPGTGRDLRVNVERSEYLFASPLSAGMTWGHSLPLGLAALCVIHFF